MTSFSPRLALSIAAAFFALAALAGTGCSSGDDSGGSGADDGASLEGKIWKATEIEGVTAVLTEEGTEVTAAFAAGELSGSGGVNRYTAAYETRSGGKIEISQPAATLMAGPPKAMAQEQAYFAALTKATQYAVTADALTLMDDDGATLVRYAVVQPTALEGTEWDALAYNNGKGGLQSLAASSAITATFGSDGSLAGNAGVNRYSTTYTTSGDTMSIDAAIATTEMAGPQELMQQEAAYLAALPRPPRTRSKATSSGCGLDRRGACPLRRQVEGPSPPLQLDVGAAAHLTDPAHRSAFRRWSWSWLRKSTTRRPFVRREIAEGAQEVRRLVLVDLRALAARGDGLTLAP